jgi:hypothetical protein
MFSLQYRMPAANCPCAFSGFMARMHPFSGFNGTEENLSIRTFS